MTFSVIELRDAMVQNGELIKSELHRHIGQSGVDKHEEIFNASVVGCVALMGFIYKMIA